MSEHGCSCNDFDRREFLAAAGLTAGLVALHSLPTDGRETDGASPRKREPATVRAAFLYPPSETFKNDPDGWWSWPGNEFDAEGRQRLYTDVLRKIAGNFGMTINITDEPIGTDKQVQDLANQLRAEEPDGLLLTMFYNRSLEHADVLLKAAEEAGVPVIFYVGLGVKHGPVSHYRREGVYFIQSLDNFDAIEYGLRMINTRKLMSRMRLLSINEAEGIREGVEKFFGTTVRVVPFSEYADAFGKISVDRRARDWIGRISGRATDVRGLTDESMENAARAHFALLQLLDRHQADGLTMNCLRRGMLKPCVSFSQLNSQLVPAACENDLPAMYTQLLGQRLIGRPGFQHNPCYETELNHYYASHCTCAPRLHGPEGPPQPAVLRRLCLPVQTFRPLVQNAPSRCRLNANPGALF